MKLASLASRNYAEPGRIAFNAAMYIAIEEHNGKEMLVCRPHAHFLENEAFMRIFAQQGKATESFTTHRCLRYLDYGQDDRGPFWFMTPGKYISLAQLMVDKPNIRLEEKWVDSTINELLDVTQYLNNNGYSTLELTPHSVMVTKDAKNLVTLMPPLTDFLPLKNEIWEESDERLAPELFNVEEPDQRADLYGIGRIIQFLHPYPTLPYKYSALVKSVTGERVDTRPTSAAAMQSKINVRGKSSAVGRIAASVAVVLALFALLIFYPWSDDPQPNIEAINGVDSTLFDDDYLNGKQKQDSYDPLVNTDITSASEAEKERLLDEYMHDSTYMSMDTAVSLSPEMKEHQRQMMILAAQKFRTAFKIQARPILEGVYTKANLKDQETFMTASQLANEQLLRIQDALCNQYQIDPTTATRISGEVIDEVAEALKKKL